MLVALGASAAWYHERQSGVYAVMRVSGKASHLPYWVGRAREA